MIFILCDKCGEMLTGDVCSKCGAVLTGGS